METEFVGDRQLEDAGIHGNPLMPTAVPPRLPGFSGLESTPEDYEKQEDEDVARRHGKYNIPEDCICGPIVETMYTHRTVKNGDDRVIELYEPVEEEMLFDTSDNEDCEMEEQAEEEAVYEDTVACLGMKSAEDDESKTTNTNDGGNKCIQYDIQGGKTLAAPSASLGSLPAVILQRIFLFGVKEPQDALPLERVCKAMHFVLRAEGTFWDQHVYFKLSSPYIIGGHRQHRCPAIEQLPPNVRSGVHERQLSTREAAFWRVGLRFVEQHMHHHVFRSKSQNLSCDNTILSALGNSADIFRSVLASIMAKMKRPGASCDEVPRIRGDTVGYLAELAQAWAVERLQSALLVAFNFERVTVTKGDIMFLDQIKPCSIFLRPQPTLSCSVGMKHHHSTSLDSCSCFCPSSGETKWHWPEDDCLGDAVLSADVRYRMVRRIAYRAVIVKISASALDLIAAEIFHLLGVLTIDAFEASKAAGYEALIHKSFCSRLTYGTPGDGIDMFSVPPIPVFAKSDVGDNGDCSLGRIYTITPGQIKAAADKRMKGKCVNGIIFGEIWVPSTGATVEEEKREEMSRYFPDDMDQGSEKKSGGRCVDACGGTDEGEDMDYEHESESDYNYESESDDETELDKEAEEVDDWMDEECDRAFAAAEDKERVTGKCVWPVRDLLM